MIIGRWTHGNFSGSFPERSFGPAASSDAIDLTGIQLRWFDHWLKGADNGIDKEPPVMLFVMGIDHWRTEAGWPLPDTQYQSYYLHSAGKANTSGGDGTLSVEPPGVDPPDVYPYDPLHPVPTTGGQVIIPGENTSGPRDQGDVEMRNNVLIYSTPVLEHPVEVTGPIELRLFVASSAGDTDFTGKLVDVCPDGRATASAWKFPAATSHASTATATRAGWSNKNRPASFSWPPTVFSMQRITRRT